MMYSIFVFREFECDYGSIYYNITVGVERIDPVRLFCRKNGKELEYSVRDGDFTLSSGQEKISSLKKMIR